MDQFDIRVAAVHENDEEQDQPLGHSDDLVTLLALSLDEVILPSLSSKTSFAFSNEIPWIRWFFSAFAESHVNLVSI